MTPSSAPSSFSESTVEDAALVWLTGLGYTVLHGPDIAAGMPGAERSDPAYRDTILEGRLRRSLARLIPELPTEALDDAFRKLTRTEAPSLIEHNRAMHRMLVNGASVEYRRDDGSIAGDQARVIDFESPENNDWLAVNQFTVVDGQQQRRPDVVLFVNGLPLAVMELENAADENATDWQAYHQLQTCQAQIPALFATNAALVVSDGLNARIGALGAGLGPAWRCARERGARPVRLEGTGGRQSRRPAGGRGLAHAGFGQEPRDGFLRWTHYPPPRDGESDNRGAHRPERPG